MGRALVVHYIDKNNEPAYKFYGYRGTWYARNSELPAVKIKLTEDGNPHLTNNNYPHSIGEPPSIPKGGSPIL